MPLDNLNHSTALPTEIRSKFVFLDGTGLGGRPWRDEEDRLTKTETALNAIWSTNSGQSLIGQIDDQSPVKLILKNQSGGPSAKAPVLVDGSPQPSLEVTVSITSSFFDFTKSGKSQGYISETGAYVDFTLERILFHELVHAILNTGTNADDGVLGYDQSHGTNLTQSKLDQISPSADLIGEASDMANDFEMIC